MTIAGYNMGGDLDTCARIDEKDKFYDAAAKLAVQRNVAQRTIMLWCYYRSEDKAMKERIESWIAEKDASQANVMSLPVYEIASE